MGSEGDRPGGEGTEGEPVEGGRADVQAATDGPGRPAGEEPPEEVPPQEEPAKHVPPQQRPAAAGRHLFHGEALFLADQLRSEGVPARVWRDRAAGGRREASFRVLVRAGDLERALAIRRERLDEEEAGRPAASSAGGRARRAGLIGAGSLGVLGFATGARVGRHLHGGGAAGLVVAIGCGVIGLLAGYVAGRATAR